MGNEYDAVIADLEAQRAEIDLLIAGLRKRAGQSPDGGGPGSRAIHSATFIGKTIPEAARTYLEMCNKRPQKTQEIAKAIQDGGYETTASNFPSMVQTVLRRLENSTGEFMRTSAGEWYLPEWYGKKATPKATRDKEETTEGAGEANHPESEKGTEAKAS